MKRFGDRYTRIMKNAEANLRIEGFHAPHQCNKDCQEMLRSNTTVDKLVAQCIKRAT